MFALFCFVPFNLPNVGGNGKIIQAALEYFSSTVLAILL